MKGGNRNAREEEGREEGGEEGREEGCEEGEEIADRPTGGLRAAGDPLNERRIRRAERRSPFPGGRAAGARANGVRFVLLRRAHSGTSAHVGHRKARAAG